jgi:alkane 1-monooxygenase
MKDLRYLIAYIPILSVYFGIYSLGIFTYSGLAIAFGVIPMVEVLSKGNNINLKPTEEDSALRQRLFDWLLYLNLPLLYGMIIYYFYTLTYVDVTTFEIVGMTLSVGVMCGTSGINVAHELGHRHEPFEQKIAQALLLPEFYMHFFIEHNLGHHKHVATPHDPATSRFGENIYAFFWRSVTQSYWSAWRIERKLLEKKGQAFWSLNNKMLRFQLMQIAYLLTIGLVFSWSIIIYAVLIGILGFLLLEAVNYIEHYGLQREQLASGKYEPIQPKHSWNSNHPLGRIVLYELTRHSDHHFKSTRKYQVLRHFDESPQLPYGYPAAILTALVPPLWFATMNKKVRH